MGRQVKKELLFSLKAGKELLFDYFSGTGPGGQNRNKSMKCVRLKHPDSGVTVTATEERSKKQNERMALKRLVENKKFMVWVKVQAAMVMEGFRSIKHKVDAMLRDPNQTKVEYLTTYHCDDCGKTAQTASKDPRKGNTPKGWTQVVTMEGEYEHPLDFCPRCKDDPKNQSN